MTAEVVVYGANGYTGKLICWKLAQYGIPFIASGRNQKRLEEQLASVPELAGADYECIAADLNEADLTELFTGKKVVYNIVGPFMQLAKPIAKAALNAGCHYFDTTGETDWCRWLRDELGAQFAAKDLVCAPATSWMWLAGEMAAEVALKKEGIDSLEIVYLGGSDTSVASTKSFYRMLANNQYFKKNNQLEEWPLATAYHVTIPGSHTIYTALPWGGGMEPIFYQNDERVRNCKVLTAMADPAATDFIVGQLKMIQEKYPGVSQEKLEEITNQLGSDLVSTEPAREDEDMHRGIISCHGRGRTTSVSVTLYGTCAYIQTGIFGAVAVQEVLAGRNKAVGFTSSCGAFGYEVFMNAIVGEGYLTSQYIE